MGKLEKHRNELMTVSEAAKAKDVPKQTLHGWIKRGWLKAYREPGKHRLYLLKSDVERLKELKDTRVIVLNPAGEK